MEVVTTLRDQGIKMGLITNADLPMWMRDIELEKLGLLGFIEVRLTAGDVGHLKPHPQPFRRALDLMGVTPDESVFVGDRIQDDVAGAQGIGMRAVWVRRNVTLWPDVSNGRPVSKPNATITQLRELLATLDLWFPGWRKVHDVESRAV
jgi:putative hydrolase of the HAD superfamily